VRASGLARKRSSLTWTHKRPYTRTDLFKTAYETDPKQLDYVNQLATAFRALDWPVVWTYVAFMESGEDCGIWGTRTDTPDSLQNIKFGSERAEFDDRLEINQEKDVIYCKKMPSAFFETALQSLCVWHQVDTLIITGGSTSGCIRATAVDSCRGGTERSCRRNASRINTRATILRTSLTWPSNMRMYWV
jgi:nicotinamidase-related amidase